MVHLYEEVGHPINLPAIIFEDNQPVIENPTSTIGGGGGTSDQTNSKLKVDEWFNKIQTHKSTRQLGYNLKSYAKILKSLGDKIATGHTSTITTTIQSNIFSSTIIHSTNLSNENADDKIKSEMKTNEGVNEAKLKPPQVAQTFQSTIIPTISSVNLDRTIFEEQKPPRTVENAPPSTGASQSSNLMHSSSLSNLLNQPINQTDIINLSQTDFSLNHSHSLSGNSNTLNNGSNAQAQILTNFSSNNSQTGSDQANLLNQNNASIGSNSQNSVLQQQQNMLNNLSSGSNLTQITQLTANLSQPPSLVVYIIDPFDFYLYNRVRINKCKQSNNGSSSNNQGNRTANKSNNSSFNKMNSAKSNLKKKVCSFF